MGEPILEPARIPVQTREATFINQPLRAGGHTCFFTCVSMGNPHAVTYVEEVEKLKIEEIGPLFETHESFPERANIEFIELVDKNSFKMRVWERGSGETLACGTGACAAFLRRPRRQELCGSRAEARLPGGTLGLEWREGRIFMTGPARTVFEGEIEMG